MSEYTPITGELRAAMRQWGWVESDGSITFTSSSLPPSIDAEKALTISGSDFDRCCNAIDAVHAQLERENAALKAENVRLLHVIGECTSQLREKHGLGYIVMPMGAAQALCETVAEIVGKRYDITDEGVEFDD